MPTNSLDVIGHTVFYVKPSINEKPRLWLSLWIIY